MSVLDCFMYSNEFDAIKIRLNELNDLVDKFIIIEGIQTFRGKEKPIFLDYIWDDLAPWHDKIHRVIVEHYPQTEDPWELEHFQRDQITRGLEEIGAAKDDIVIVSDADEIPNPKVVSKLNLWSGPIHLEMNTYYFYLDLKVPDQWNQGGRPFVAIREQMGSPQEMRDTPKRFVLDGAWHFSYLAAPMNVRWKIKAFAHSEYDTPENTDLEKLNRRRLTRKDPLGRFYLDKVEVDETYPVWVQENRDQLKYLFCPV
jgi:beta-1,4-mannosyl-glycoprotein beta-1,4-N-acetylglucosaminyltransferase